MYVIQIHCKNNSKIKILTRYLISHKHSDNNEIKIQATQVIFSINTMAHAIPNNNHSLLYLQNPYPMNTMAPAILSNTQRIPLPPDTYLILTMKADISPQPLSANAYNTYIHYPNCNNNPKLEHTHSIKPF